MTSYFSEGKLPHLNERVVCQAYFVIIMLHINNLSHQAENRFYTPRYCLGTSWDN